MYNKIVSNKPVLYTIGAFRGACHWEQEKNIRLAEECALRLWHLGAIVLCPHTNTRNFQGAAPDEIWMEGDLELMRRCDGVFLVPGWKKSKGSLIEVAKAQEWHLHIFKSFNQVHEYLQELHRLRSLK